jgi:hypothetical protein
VGPRVDEHEAGIVSEIVIAPFIGSEINSLANALAVSRGAYASRMTSEHALSRVRLRSGLLDAVELS